MNRSRTIIRICELLAEQENLKVTIEEAAIGATIVGASTFLGALLGGRGGLLAGAAIGSAVSLLVASDFKPVVEIIRNDMTEAQRYELAQNVGILFSGIQLTDVAAGLAILASNHQLKTTVIQEITNYFRTEMSMTIM